MARKKHVKKAQKTQAKNKIRKPSPFRFVLYALPFIMLIIAVAAAFAYVEGMISYNAANGISVVATSMLFSTAVIAYFAYRVSPSPT